MIRFNRSGRVDSVIGLGGLLAHRVERPDHAMHDIQAAPVALFESNETWDAGTPTTTAGLVGVGKQSLLLTSVNAVNASAKANLPMPAYDQAVYPMHEILLYVDDVTKLDTITLYAGTDSGMTKSFTVTTPTGAAFPKLMTGWNLVRVRWSQFGKTGGITDADWANITYLLVRAKSLSGQTVNVYFSSWRVVHPRPTIMLCHHDGFADMETFWEIEEANNLRSSNFIVSRWPESDPQYITWPKLWAAHRRGHDVCSHGAAHMDYATDSPEQALIEADMQEAYTTLIGRGFTRGVRFLATPYGRGSAGGLNGAAIWAAAAKYCVALQVGAATAGDGYRYPNNGDIPNVAVQQYAQSSVSNTDTPSIATVKGWIDTCVARGTVLGLNTHKIGATADGNTITRSFYEQLCGYIRGLVESDQADCMTISEFYDLGARIYGQEPMAYRESINPADGTAVITKIV